MSASSRPPIVLAGAGGHARVVADIIAALGLFELVGGLDDDVDSYGLAAPRLGGMDWLGQPPPAAECLALGIGNNPARERFAETARRAGWRLPALVSPSATVSPSVDVGDGVVIMAGAVVNADARLGPGAIVNTGATVDHDCDVGSFALIAPGANLAGGVRVGERTLVGTGASAVPGVRIGDDVTVGAGAAVVTDLPDGCTALGVPARPIDR